MFGIIKEGDIVKEVWLFAFDFNFKLGGMACLRPARCIQIKSKISYMNKARLEKCFIEYRFIYMNVFVIPYYILPRSVSLWKTRRENLPTIEAALKQLAIKLKL